MTFSTSARLVSAISWPSSSAVTNAFSAAFAQAGQRCTDTSRLIVADSVAQDLTSRLRAKVTEIVLGPGLDPATTMGPLSYAAHRDAVLGHIERAREEGAPVIAGGGRPRRRWRTAATSSRP
jgi:alpha-ketoglutaric semialdehyde dehydrogenase